MRAHAIRLTRFASVPSRCSPRGRRSLFARGLRPDHVFHRTRRSRTSFAADPSALRGVSGAQNKRMVASGHGSRETGRANPKAVEPDAAGEPEWRARGQPQAGDARDRASRRSERAAPAPARGPRVDVRVPHHPARNERKRLRERAPVAGGRSSADASPGRPTSMVRPPRAGLASVSSNMLDACRARPAFILNDSTAPLVRCRASQTPLARFGHRP